MALLFFAIVSDPDVVTTPDVTVVNPYVITISNSAVDDGSTVYVITQSPTEVFSNNTPYSLFDPASIVKSCSIPQL